MKSARKLVFILLAFVLVIVVGLAAWLQLRPTAAPKKQQPRIVATTVAVTEMAAKLNLPLVGVPTSANQLPARYQSVTKVGSPMTPNVEKIAAVKPTVVYSVTVLKDQYEATFKQQHFNAQYLNLDTVASLKQTLTTLGQRYQRQTQAKKQVKLIDQAINKVQARQQGSKPKVLILMGMPGAGYMIATDTSYIGDLVRLAGGENLYPDKTQPYLAPDNEKLAQQRPDVILRLEHAMPEVVKPQFEQEFKQNSIWAQMPAVQQQRVYDLQQPKFDATANMQVTTALQQVSQWLYPAK
ncbi:heme ABC transporter substrate-binding protein IsdE [Loigolactobacillus zhaoyuanensis]|uniref:heme ABC transporter substrate-binding protein IsdE n=1 Tax=Loigolactobacillus zhaoyuanensis TaxID=2486017 RepID=UPI000F7369DA|nr:heme ABC transporter substrate-binding protein IsdE [Loigolactobacillus zhaoyuanensis]